MKDKLINIPIGDDDILNTIDPGVYNLPNKTRISCGKISETFRENVEAYSKTANDKSVYFEIVKA